MADVEATVEVFKYPPIWEKQKNRAFFCLVTSSNSINLPPKAATEIVYDSDTDDVELAIKVEENDEPT